MKPHQLATLLNISAPTLRRWAGKEYSEFLSPSAQGLNGAARSFSEQDARVIAWIALLKAQNTPTEDVLTILRSAQGSGWKNLPPMPGGMVNDEPIAVVPREAVEERVRALQERYELQLQAVTKERDELRTRLETFEHETALARHEMTDTLKNQQIEHSKAVQELQKRIIDLTAQEAELRGKLEQYMLGGRRWNIATVIIVALLLGAALTILSLTIGALLSAR